MGKKGGAFLSYAKKKKNEIIKALPRPDELSRDETAHDWESESQKRESLRLRGGSLPSPKRRCDPQTKLFKRLAVVV